MRKLKHQGKKWLSKAAARNIDIKVMKYKMHENV